MRSLVLVAALLPALAAAAASPPLYKSTMPDGKVIYSEKPVPGAKRVDTVEPPPARTGTTTVTPGEQQRAAAKPRETAPQQSSPLEDARSQLKQAEAARESGKEPLPGERQGTAGGTSRLTDAYHARQKSLELGVEAARKRVEELEKSR
jgi:hypothetical protein